MSNATHEDKVPHLYSGRMNNEIDLMNNESAVPRMHSLINNNDNLNKRLPNKSNNNEESKEEEKENQ